MVIISKIIHFLHIFSMNFKYFSHIFAFYLYIQPNNFSNSKRVSSRGVMTNELDYSIVVIEFEFQSRVYIRNNNIGKDMNFLIFQL